MSFLLVAQRALTVPGWVKNTLWRAAKATPSLDLPFAESKSLVDAITGRQLISYARAGSGTYTDSAGVLQTAVTNLLTYSENLTLGFSQQNTTVTSDATTAPDGTTTADLSVPTATSASHASFRTGITFAVSTSYALSVFVKPSGYTNFQLAFTSGFNNTNAWANFVLVGGGSLGFTGTSGTAAIQALRDGWYRCSLVAPSGASATTGGPAVLVLDSNRNSRDPSFAGDGTSGAFLWGAQLEQSSTVGEYVPTGSTINSAPRFDHNPLTGESLGLLVEEQRTNSIRNNTMVGAVAGTPGTLPTNWVGGGAAGLAREIVGIGVENGIAYVDVRYFGTTTVTLFQSLTFEVATQVAATQSSIWTCSAFMKLVGGSLANVNSIVLVIDNYNSSGTPLSQYAVSSPLALTTSALITQRYSASSTSSTFSNAATAFVRPYLQINANSGVAIDITLRVGLPQLEQNATASSVIPTTTAAATRNADVVSITGTNFSSWYRQDEGTWFGDAFREFAVPASAAPVIVDCRSFGGSPDINQFSYLTESVAGMFVGVGGVIQSELYPVGLTGVRRRRIATAYAANNFAASANGSTPLIDLTGSIGSPSSMTIGAVTGGTQYLNGHIRRLTYWPQALPGQLQAITQP